jgi:hypothetical protein
VATRELLLYEFSNILRPELQLPSALTHEQHPSERNARNFPPELLMSYPVTPKMNRASFNEPAAITQLEPSIAA